VSVLALLLRPGAASPILDRFGILICMTAGTTTIKVSTRTRDALRQLADRDGRTMDAQLDALISRERRRIIGSQIASEPPDGADVMVLDASATDVADASR
jgi:hypothetical protein